jgi:hypothetical protein
VKGISLRQKGKGSGIKVCARRHSTSSGCFKLGTRSLLWPRLEVYVSLLHSTFSYTSSIINLALEFPPLLPSPIMPDPNGVRSQENVLSASCDLVCRKTPWCSNGIRIAGHLIFPVSSPSKATSPRFHTIISYAPKPKFDLSMAVNLAGWTLLPGISIDTSVCSDSVCSGAS